MQTHTFISVMLLIVLSVLLISSIIFYIQYKIYVGMMDKHYKEMGEIHKEHINKMQTKY